MPKGIISDTYRRELAGLLDDFIATPGLDWESRRRAQWLAVHLLEPDQPAERVQLSAVG